MLLRPSPTTAFQLALTLVPELGPFALWGCLLVFEPETTATRLVLQVVGELGVHEFGDSG